MPKKLLATTIILALAITMLSAIPMSRANMMFNFEPQIIMYNPTSFINVENPVTLIVWVRVPQNYSEFKQFYYVLDGNSAVKITNITKSDEPWLKGNTIVQYTVTAVLENLAKEEVGEDL